jgi:uncharacterized SAM-binding protein YcdF (DUF218 family)
MARRRYAAPVVNPVCRVLVGGTVASAVGLAGAASLYPPSFPRTPSDTRADAALVLSGDVDYLRVRHAAALQTSGLVRFVIVTGTGVGGDSAVELAAQARKLGVAEPAIVREERSQNTHENLVNAAPIIRAHGWRRMALVTSASHMGRALRVARRVMPELDWVPAPVPDAGPRGRIYRTRLGEWAKLGWYGLRGWI